MNEPTSRLSLQTKTRQRLERMGCRCATVQVHLSFSPQQNLREYSWDRFLISSIWNSLYPTQPLAISQLLLATARLSSKRRLEHLVCDLLFPELREKPLLSAATKITYEITSVGFSLRKVLREVGSTYIGTRHYRTTGETTGKFKENIFIW